MNRRLCAVTLVSAAVLMACGGCSRSDTAGTAVSELEQSQPAVSEQYSGGSSSAAASVPVENPVDADTASEIGYCQGLLNDAEQQLYLRILDAAGKMEPTITETDFDADTMTRVVDYVCADHPELFWLDGSEQTSTKTIDGVPVEVTLTFRYNMDAASQPAASQAVEAAAQECLNSVDPAWDDYEKIKAVYDWVILRVTYDTSERDQSLYSAMVEGRAVCAGYARATQYLLQRLDIPCTYVSGTARGASHGWDLVVADGAYYYLDPTWGDPLFAGGQQDPNSVDYDYFCITTEDLLRTHTPGTLFELPQCTATACNYYVHNGLLLEEYDPDAVQEIVNRAVAGKQDASFRFTTPEALEGAKEALIGQQEVFGILKAADSGTGTLETTSISYSENEELNIFTLYLTYL